MSPEREPRRPEHPFRWSPGGPGVALLALGVVISALTAFGVLSAHVTDRAARRTGEAVRLSDSYQRARFAVGEEESLERKYRLEPSARVRAAHRAAAVDLEAQLRSASRHGAPSDRARVATLLSVHERYLAAVDAMFAAVDAGDDRRVGLIDEGQADPLFSDLEQRVDAAARRKNAAAQARLTSLRTTERATVVATPIVFGVGLALLALLAAQLTAMFRRIRRQAELSAHDALHDALTGLPNRTLFSDRLEHQIQRTTRDPAPFSVLVVDLDRFKDVNDTLGHATGDRLLREIGGALSRALRPGDSVARLGGDEFAVLLPEADSEAAAGVAARIITALHGPFELPDQTFTVDASIGIVSSPAHGHDAQTLMQRADVAMYIAKERGIGIAPYDEGADPNNPQRLALVGELRRAIAAGQLELDYQPKFETSDLRVSGVEALVRWRHPTRGLLPPDEFIAVAERTGLIRPLTLLVLRDAARQCRAWNDAGLDLTVAVNLSVANLLDPTLVGDVAAILEQEGLAADRLELEITEGMVMRDPERAITQLHDLAAMGIKLAIDDFGTGYSSLAYLRRLPVSELKIDREFVQRLSEDEDDASIVRSTVDLAHNLGLQVVAEGVEDAASMAILTRIGCDRVQGFHLCRPAPPAELLAQLERSSRRCAPAAESRPA